MTDDIKRELGYTILEVNEIRSGNQFEVVVEHPDLEGKQERFTFKNNDNWNRKREYVDEDGTVREEYNWMAHIRKHLRKHHENDLERETTDFDSDEFEGGSIEV